MRPVRKITAEEENFRVEQKGMVGFIRRNPVKPEPEGTIVLMAFRVVGYDPDCDGSLMARLEHIDKNGDETGATLDHMGLYSDTDLVVTLDELKQLFEKESSHG